MQTFVDDCFDENHSAYDDLQNMENNFAALKSNFSGISSPANAVAGMDWFDSDNHVNKRYDAGWLGLMHGDIGQKIWVYRNDSIPGWVIDSSVGDVVIAAKGAGVYGTAGQTAGSWVVSGLSHQHNHQFCKDGGDDASNSVYDSGGGLVPVGGGFKYPSTTMVLALSLTHEASVNAGSSSQRGLGDSYTNNDTTPVQCNGLWRVAAAVNTLQVLNI